MRDGFVIETGADSFLTEKPWAPTSRAVSASTRELIPTRENFAGPTSCARGGWSKFPTGFSLLAPTRMLGPVLRSPLFSPLGKLRMALEPLIPRRERGSATRAWPRS